MKSSSNKGMACILSAHSWYASQLNIVQKMLIDLLLQFIEKMEIHINTIQFSCVKRFATLHFNLISIYLRDKTPKNIYFYLSEV